MSYFGERTPQQELLMSSGHIKLLFDLTDEQLVIILLQVTQAVIDPLDNKADEIRNMMEVDL